MVWGFVCLMDTGAMPQMTWGFVCWITGAMDQMMWVFLFLVGYRSNVSDDVGFCLLDTGAMHQMI